MNRRDAIKRLTALGTLGAIPGLVAAAAGSGNTQNKRLHIVGLGGGGCNALEFIHRQGFQAKYTCVTHPERPHLAGDIDFIRHIPPCWLKSEERSIFLSDRTQKMEMPSRVRRLFSNDHYFILLAGLGGFTGTKMVEELTLYLDEHNRDFLAICSRPFAFEGSIMIDFAEPTRTRLQHIPGFKCFELEKLRSVYGDLKISELFARADEQFYKVLLETTPEYVRL